MNVEQAIQLLKNEGYKYTGKRVEILEFFAGHDRYLTAKDVLEGIKPNYPGLSFDTIYRNLSLFHDLGILEETTLSGEKHFRFVCSHSEHHHHLICLECGKTKKIATCPMDKLLGEVDDFTIADHKFEVYGYCDGCKNKKESRF